MSVNGSFGDDPKLPHRQHQLVGSEAAAAILGLTCLFLGASLTLWVSKPPNFHSFRIAAGDSRLAWPGLVPTEAVTNANAQRQHDRLAVLIPYRDLPAQLAQMLPITAACLQRSGADFSIFILEQAPGLAFNRGALFNAGALLLAGSEYDCLVLQDVDTVCGNATDNITADHALYRCPSGNAPLHLTPPGMHPNNNYPTFFGGNVVFTQQQFARVNGFSHNFWGWGKEDDNMVTRLRAHHMWPSEWPDVAPLQQGQYWVHLKHSKTEPLHVVSSAPGASDWANLQPGIFSDRRSGLRETNFQIQRIEAASHNATRILLQLGCDRKLTPWC